MVVLIALCNLTFTKFIKNRLIFNKFYSNKQLCSPYTDSFIENLVLEEGIKQELNLSKYLRTVRPQTLLRETLSKISLENENSCRPNTNGQFNVEHLVHCIEEEVNTKLIPNEKLKYILVYFTKDGNINGVKAIQYIVKKHNVVHFKSQAEYNHYLAEALWVSGKMHKSLQLFSFAYDNIDVRPKVKVMITNLFPLLIAKHSDATLCKFIKDIELFSKHKGDSLILACLWRELFQSTWFSDQEQASKLFLKNNHLLKSIHWMVPSMGNNLLRSHRIEDFYRLIQFTLETELKSMTDVLIRHLFEYYYIHQNIERCTAVVKYSSNMNSPLTEEQQRRYVSLLLKSKDAACSKLMVKKPQVLKYMF